MWPTGRQTGRFCRGPRGPQSYSEGGLPRCVSGWFCYGSLSVSSAVTAPIEQSPRYRVRAIRQSAGWNRNGLFRRASCPVCEQDGHDTPGQNNPTRADQRLHTDLESEQESPRHQYGSPLTSGLGAHDRRRNDGQTHAHRKEAVCPSARRYCPFRASETERLETRIERPCAGRDDGPVDDGTCTRRRCQPRREHGPLVTDARCRIQTVPGE